MHTGRLRHVAAICCIVVVSGQAKKLQVQELRGDFLHAFYAIDVDDGFIILRRLLCTRARCRSHAFI